MLSETITAIIRAEMGRHKFDTYVDDPPSIAQGQLVDHLTKSVVRAVQEAAREPEETAGAALCRKVSKGLRELAFCRTRLAARTKAPSSAHNFRRSLVATDRAKQASQMQHL